LELLWLLDCCFPQTMASHPIAAPACASPIAIDKGIWHSTQSLRCPFWDEKKGHWSCKTHNEDWKNKTSMEIDEQKPSHLGLVSLVQPTTQTEQETSLTMISTNERAF
jgi:hypothetical protein